MILAVITKDDPLYEQHKRAKEIGKEVEEASNQLRPICDKLIQEITEQDPDEMPDEAKSMIVMLMHKSGQLPPKALKLLSKGTKLKQYFETDMRRWWDEVEITYGLAPEQDQKAVVYEDRIEIKAHDGE